MEQLCHIYVILWSATDIMTYVNIIKNVNIIANTRKFEREPLSKFEVKYCDW